MKGWIVSLDGVLGILVLVAGFFLDGPSVRVEAWQPVVYFGVIVLGTGMLLDLWRLLVEKVKPGQPRTAMCVESVVGMNAVGIGLVLLAFPHWDARVAPSAIAWFLGGSLIASAYLHDLVMVKDDERWSLLRDPEHGSFILTAARHKNRST